MRIPSQFNEDNLYRRRNRHRDTGEAYRRIIRLSVGLLLVVVLMQQAAKPAIYQTFFGPQGTGENPDPAPSRESNLVGSPTEADDANAENDAEATSTDLPTTTDRRIATRVVATLPIDEQAGWLAALVRWSSESNVHPPASVVAARNYLMAFDGLTQEQQTEWSSLFDALARPDSAPDRDTQRLAAAMTSALGAAAAGRVIDGSVWRSEDFDAFYWYLHQAPELTPTGVAATGVLPLLQQPDVFRDQLVRTVGTIERVERIEASDNAWGIPQYWQLWLRPADGAERPIVVIVPSIPASLQSSIQADLDQSPAISVVGRFLKRLAYRSSVGADLAPVIVGRIIPAEVNRTTTASNTVRRPGAAGTWAAVLAACSMGIALAVLAMWRTAAAAKRTRALRHQRQEPNEFLSRIDDSTAMNVGKGATETKKGAG